MIGYPQAVVVFDQLQNAISTPILVSSAALWCHEGIIVKQKFIGIRTGFVENRCKSDLNHPEFSIRHQNDQQFAVLPTCRVQSASKHMRSNGYF